MHVLKYSNILSDTQPNSIGHTCFKKKGTQFATHALNKDTPVIED